MLALKPPGPGLLRFLILIVTFKAVKMFYIMDRNNKKGAGYMKKRILLFLFMLMSVSVFAASFKKGDKVYVSVKTVTMKSTSGGGAKNVSDLSYGDELKVLSVSGNKIQVQLASNQKKSGWISANTVTKKKIVKTSGGGKVSASSSELALAGKGFTEESEKVVESADEDMDYSKVDAIESVSVSDSELESFIIDGHLQGAGK